MRIEIAERVFGLEHQYDFVAQQCARFATEREPDATFSSEGVEFRDEVINGMNVPKEYMECSFFWRKVVEWLFDREPVMMLHGVAIDHQGVGYIFTAPSGTGKSTHARMWKKAFPGEVKVINGDKPLLRFEPDGTLRAYGTPWCGKEGWSLNASTPIAAIVVLHQAPTNSIVPMAPIEAFRALIEQAFRSDNYGVEQMQRTMAMVEKLTRMPVYSLGCTPTPEAAKLCQSIISKKQNTTTI